MKPYCEIDGITIYHGDFLEGSKVIEDKSVQMVFADPPFNIGKLYGGTTGDNRKDYFPWCRKWVDICFAKLMDTGSIYLMTLPRHLPELYAILRDTDGVFVNEIHWRNVSASHDRRSYWGSFQPILFYGKTDGYVFHNRIQTRKNLERWTEHKSGPRGQILDYWDDIPFVYAGSVAHKEAIMKPGTRQKFHPCQMPVALAERPIIFSTNPGDTILDPFGGIGASAVAAKKTGRKCIIFEINERYCEIIANRSRQTTLALEVAPKPKPTQGAFGFEAEGKKN
jgi:site-specific DNA-methyltransferase (adenine-specific)